MTIPRDKLLKLAEQAGLGQLFENGLWNDHRATKGAVLEFAALLSEAQEGEQTAPCAECAGTGIIRFLKRPSQAQAQDEELCYCDRNNLGEPGVSCGDCPTRDYRHLRPSQAQEPQLSSMLNVIVNGSTVSILFDSPASARAFSDRTNAAARAANASESGAVGERSAHNIDQIALEASRKIMALVYGPIPKGGSVQLQAQIQCEIIDALSRVQAAPEPVAVTVLQLGGMHNSYYYGSRAHHEMEKDHVVVQLLKDIPAGVYLYAAPSVQNEQGGGK